MTDSEFTPEERARLRRLIVEADQIEAGAKTTRWILAFVGGIMLYLFSEEIKGFIKCHVSIR